MGWLGCVRWLLGLGSMPSWEGKSFLWWEILLKREPIPNLRSPQNLNLFYCATKHNISETFLGFLNNLLRRTLERCVCAIPGGRLSGPGPSVIGDLFCCCFSAPTVRALYVIVHHSISPNHPNFLLLNSGRRLLVLQVGTVGMVGMVGGHFTPPLVSPISVQGLFYPVCSPNLQ